MHTLALSIASTIITGHWDSYHTLAQYADSSTLALALVLASINR